MIAKETGEARGTVGLKKGIYAVVVFMQGRSGDEDAAFVSVGGRTYRMWTGSYDRVSVATCKETETESFPFTADRDGPVEVVISKAELNVYVDRVVFRKK